MAGDTIITIIGNLTADPQLRYTPSGAAVTNFTVASTPRSFDRHTGQCRDGEALFLRCRLWRQPAENAADLLTQGTQVIVSGRLTQRSFQTRDGEHRTMIELDVDDLGPSLRTATAAVTKTSPSRADASPPEPARGESDPRASTPSAPVAGEPVDGGYDEEPPF